MNVTAARSGTFRIGSDTEVNRLGFGTMRLTGRGIWGPPLDRPEAIRTLQRLPQLRLDTPVRRRPDCTWTISPHDRRLRVSFHTTHLDVPAHIEPDVRFISTKDVFTAAELPGVLDDEGRLVLVRRLVREGALTFT